MASLLDKLKDRFTNLTDSLQTDDAQSSSQEEALSHPTIAPQTHPLLHQTAHNRFHSFAPSRPTNNAGKWFVDGCGYFYALSLALAAAQQEIWIMDWWLSPELYLRRPPSKNEDWRLDRVLQAAAQRGVKVRVMVYKEVEAALTLDSIHTKHALEALHPNISVFRHPDHNPSGRDILSNFKNLALHSGGLANLGHTAKEALYGISDDVVLYWAHHEKLCVIDGTVAFMGGLDACFGRWDTNNHPIADAHPSDLNEIIFPGQDYNNARVMDFANVEKWEDNKLDRTKESRMGWSDLSICIEGPVVEDLRAHFIQRWNYLYACKYSVVSGHRYHKLSLGYTSQYYREDGKNLHEFDKLEEMSGLHPGHVNADESTSEFGDGKDHLFHHRPGGFIDKLEEHLHGFDRFPNHDVNRSLGQNATLSIHLCRSVTRWSHGVATEHSIVNAYIEVIANSEHFIYIENQFFITATSPEQDPVLNKIGAALVDRITLAAKSRQKFKVIIAMPAVPAFAGDLHAESSLGTRAIMDFQYKSISRGGYSITEKLRQEGVNPKDYISFYNLRNYDRINVGEPMEQAEQASGVKYEDARKEHDDHVGAGFSGQGEGTTGPDPSDPNSDYAKYQATAKSQTASASLKISSKNDTVSPCYMHPFPSLSSIPWTGAPEKEIDAFVSEELYIHSKTLIADDRIAIIGSANLNDRSQLGYHDSEIAVVIEDSATIATTMNDVPYSAARFAASLRRQLTRKHLGLIRPQDPEGRDERGILDMNYVPIGNGGNRYDWGSELDKMVEDPLGEGFEKLWKETARTNTEVFEKVFRPVPTNAVRNWHDYQDYYAKYYIPQEVKKEDEKKDEKKDGQEVKESEAKEIEKKIGDRDVKEKKEAIYAYGHVFKEAFPGGVEDVKKELEKVRGSLVEMPLEFLVDVGDLAKEGFSYNSLTDSLYT